MAQWYLRILNILFFGGKDILLSVYLYACVGRSVCWCGCLFVFVCIPCICKHRYVCPFLYDYKWMTLVIFLSQYMHRQELSLNLKLLISYRPNGQWIHLQVSDSQSWVHQVCFIAFWYAWELGIFNLGPHV